MGNKIPNAFLRENSRVNGIHFVADDDLKAVLWGHDFMLTLDLTEWAACGGECSLEPFTKAQWDSGDKCTARSQGGWRSYTKFENFLGLWCLNESVWGGSVLR